MLLRDVLDREMKYKQVKHTTYHVLEARKLNIQQCGGFQVFFSNECFLKSLPVCSNSRFKITLHGTAYTQIFSTNKSLKSNGTESSIIHTRRFSMLAFLVTFSTKPIPSSSPHRDRATEAADASPTCSLNLALYRWTTDAFYNEHKRTSDKMYDPSCASSLFAFFCTAKQS